MTLKKEDGTPDIGRHVAVTLESLDHFLTNHPNPNVDLVAIPIGTVLNSAVKDGKDYYFAPLGNESRAISCSTPFHQ